ncbi:unnamed protein product [Durusdinium trenchii]|uniref:Peptidase A1 domain-containing protein n=1 Tax=Durusdinium trenchii TaxID=1381693 RepID=A0ABP0R2K2_9DINO
MCFMSSASLAAQLTLLSIGDLFQQNPEMRARLGCHQEETRLFYTQKANGIMGIRQPQEGQPTLLQQLMRDRDRINADIFTMCIADSGGRLTVGGLNESDHRGEVKYIKMRLSGGFFNVYLQAVSIAGSAAAGFGTTIIDSGTTWTYFGSRPYRAIRKGIEDFCSAQKSCGIQRGNCWEASDLSGFPDLQMDFDGVDVRWVPRAYLYRKAIGTRWCYSFQDDGPGASTVLGASWMMHQDVIFDMARQRVGVVPADCPRHQIRPEHDPEAMTRVRGATITSVTTSSKVHSVLVQPLQVKKFNIGLLWAGLASGACLATGFISIVAAACRPQAPSEKADGKDAKHGEVIGKAQATDEEENELLVHQEGAPMQNFLKIA